MLNSKRPTLIPQIQLFAEDDPPPQNNDPAPNNPSAGKTYSEDYVHNLRNEAAGYRTTAKAHEKALRTILGIADGEELGNMVCIGFILNELISVVENIGLMGVPMPKVIVKAIDILKKKEDERNE